MVTVSTCKGTPRVTSCHHAFKELPCHRHRVASPAVSPVADRPHEPIRSQMAHNRPYAAGFPAAEAGLTCLPPGMVLIKRLLCRAATLAPTRLGGPLGRAPATRYSLAVAPHSRALGLLSEALAGRKPAFEVRPATSVPPDGAIHSSPHDRGGARPGQRDTKSQSRAGATPRAFNQALSYSPLWRQGALGVRVPGMLGRTSPSRIVQDSPDRSGVRVPGIAL